jgi:hypothetical protein
VLFLHKNNFGNAPLTSCNILAAELCGSAAANLETDWVSTLDG